MGIEDSFIWYQKKIGTYDKQQWETTIEQKILSGLNHIPLRSTKPNTDLIDLDLVRGSSFSKAKPQHGFITVLRQATLRSIFLPFYAKWWIQLTSKSAFTIFFLLYLSLWLNFIIFFEKTLFSENDSNLPKIVPYCEILIPFMMTWLVTLICSQIVSTKPISDTPKSIIKSKQYRRRRNIFRKTTGRVSFADTLTSTNQPNPKITLSNDNLSDNDEKEMVASKSVLKRKRVPFIRVNNRGRKKSELSSKRSLEECSCDKRSEKGDSPPRPRKNQEDDGFESLCGGNGSRTSEEEVPTTPDCSVCEKCDAWVEQVRAASADNCRSTSESKTFSSDSDSDQELMVPETTELESTFDDTEDDFPAYLGVTTNSDDCSYSSDIDEVCESTHFKGSFDLEYSPIMNPPSAKVSCIVWEGKDIKKADLSMLDISSSIIAKVEAMPASMNYFYTGFFLSVLLGLLPVIRSVATMSNPFEELDYAVNDLNSTVLCDMFISFAASFINSFGSSIWERVFTITASVQRCILASCCFFLLSLAERTFKQRFLYAKLFSHLTSLRRAQKSKLPHFRLNKVRNIKTWLSVRSYLKKRGPQRSVDVIVSTAFLVLLLLMSFLCIELLNDTLSLDSQYNIEALIWCFGLGILLFRFLSLGTKINKKYRNLSVLLTEQINLYLQIEQKPHKKEELTVANNVLKLAIDLLKELESPFKIIGLSANPILSNIAKVVILSALSGVLSDMLGFKLKLHKIKIK